MKISKIVIIEDDVEVRNMLKTLFMKLDYEVDLYESSEAFLLSANKPMYAVYIIDDHLPGIQGHDLVAALRSRDLISPIFMVSGSIDESIRRQTLMKGADDYINKPFDPEHLALRIRTAVERANVYLNARIDTGIKLIPKANTVVVNGKAVSFSDREYRILSYLMGHPKQIVTRQELVSNFEDSEITMRTVDVHISSIRRKLDGLELTIETCRGKGYMASFESSVDPIVINGHSA